jgi:hypothetical protein
MTFIRGVAMLRACLGVTVCILSAAAADVLAGTLAVESREPSALTMRLTGFIEEGDADKLSAILKQLRASAPATPVTIRMSSRGGDLYEAIKLGKLIHGFPAATVVRRGDICLSACAFAFLGGAAPNEHANTADRSLEIGGKVGFHTFSLNPAALPPSTSDRRDDAIVSGFNRARGAASSVIDYATEMGISGDFIGRILGRPVEEFDYIDTVDQFIRLSVCPLGIARPSVPLATQAINVSNNMTSLAAVAAELRSTPIAANVIRRYLLETVQAGMMSLNVKGALSDQLASYSVMRNERATASLYDDLRAAGVPLPAIVGPTFEITGYRAGVYDLRTIVSLSSEDPDRYSLATLGPKGIAPPSRSPPPNCRRLFLFDRQDQLNP